MELDSRKNEARADLKQQDIAIEVSIGPPRYKRSAFDTLCNGRNFSTSPS
jgi:hypothetical protein